jgi:CubicO group peptidase (beta-lactamase class C family)
MLAGLLLLALAPPAPARELPRAGRPEDVGLSSERLARLSATIQRDVDQKDIPGAVVVIGRRGKIAYSRAFGFHDRETGAPMPLDAIHRIASMTKPLTSVAVMTLVEEGRINLTDAVARHLPEFKDVQVGVEKKDETGAPQLVAETPQRAMTIHDLLRHTSGLTYGFFGRSLVKDRYRAANVMSSTQTNAEFVTNLARLPLHYHPGTTWEYGVSTDVLGRIAEVVSGMPLDRFVAERVTDPLGMRDTGFAVDRADGRARIAEPQADPGTGTRPAMPDITRKPVWLSGGGGLVSTAPDYARFAQLLLDGGELHGVRVLSRKTVEYMTSDHLASSMRVNGFPIPAIDTRPENGGGFGLGFAVRVSPGRSAVFGSAGDFGWVGIWGTQFWVDPKEQMFAVMMLQTASDPIRHRYWALLRALVYQAVAD